MTTAAFTQVPTTRTVFGIDRVEKLGGDVRALAGESASALLIADPGVAKLGLAFLLGVRGKVPEFHVDEDLPVYRVPAALAGANLDDLLTEARSLRKR